jgi:ABC-type transporter Mla subunit MlaD
MSLEASKFRLGVFFSIGSLMFVVAMIWLTGWFKHQETRTYVCYFTESVQGLESGSSVRFNGVPVGKVRTIDVVTVIVENPRDTLSFVEVVLEIRKSFDVRPSMVARLDLIGITGIKVVNISVAGQGDSPQATPRELTSPYEKIPVVESQLETLDVGLQRLVEILTEVDVKEISDQTVLLLENLNGLMGSDSVSVIMHSVALTSSRVDTLAMVYTELGRNLNALALRAGESFPNLAGNLDSLTREFTTFVTEFEPVVRQANELLSQMYTLMSGLQTIVDRMRDNPEGLLAPAQEEDEWP